MEFPSYPKGWDNTIKRIKKRDGYTCKSCNTKHPRNSPWLRVHHKIPLSKGGTNNDSNLTTLCWKCHAKEHPHIKKWITSNNLKTQRKDNGKPKRNPFAKGGKTYKSKYKGKASYPRR